MCVQYLELRMYYTAYVRRKRLSRENLST